MAKYEMCVVSIAIGGNLTLRSGDEKLWDWVEEKLASSEYARREYQVISLGRYNHTIKKLKEDVWACGWWLTALLCDDGWEPFDGGSAGSTWHFSFRRKLA